MESWFSMSFVAYVRLSARAHRFLSRAVLPVFINVPVEYPRLRMADVERRCAGVCVRRGNVGVAQVVATWPRRWIGLLRPTQHRVVYKERYRERARPSSRCAVLQSRFIERNRPVRMIYLMLERFYFAFKLFFVLCGDLPEDTHTHMHIHIFNIWASDRSWRIMTSPNRLDPMAERISRECWPRRKACLFLMCHWKLG